MPHLVMTDNYFRINVSIALWLMVVVLALLLLSRVENRAASILYARLAAFGYIVLWAGLIGLLQLLMLLIMNASTT